MRVVIKKTAEALDANVSKLEDKLDVCSCQIEAMECAFEDARLQGKAFDAIRAHCKGLKGGRPEGGGPPRERPGHLRHREVRRTAGKL